MAAVTALQRVEVVARLVELIEQRVTDSTIVVLNGPPRDPQQHKMIAVGDITGELEVAHLTAGRKRYDDRFTVELLCMAWDPGAPDFAVVDPAVQELAEIVHDAVADSPNLQVLTSGDGLGGVVAAMVGRVDGPNRWWNPEGVGSAMRVDVGVHVRMF